MADIRTVGILNITPDSFSDGGHFVDADAAVSHASELFASGAEFVDIGAESTNPSSKPMTAEQEIARLAPIISPLINTCGPDRFSLDTYHPQTLVWALEQGMRPILNDVSGLHDPAMADIVHNNNLRVIVSHLPKNARGIPTRAHTTDAIDDIDQVVAELLQTAEHLRHKGLPKTHIILDPGIGFGKTMRLNWQLLDIPSHIPGYDIMLGYSRKRFLHTTHHGIEIPEAITLKQQGGEPYKIWLAQQHDHIRNHIATQNKASQQTIYLRLHIL
jgi:dihydropteroate synthase